MTIRFTLKISIDPGAIGAGGVILNSDGQKLMEFSWGLGQSTDNSAEALEIYMGVHLITDISPVKLVVIGDSDLIIKGL